MVKRFFITTMGCQMNEDDSDHLAQSLIASGYKQVDDPSQAHVILVNTCAVRHKPEHKAFSLLGRFSHLKKGKKDRVLGVVGCVAQKQGSRLLERFPQVDLVMGPREIGRINEYLNRIEENGERIVGTDLNVSPPPAILSKGCFRGRVAGYISIMQGCNNWCSYCIVPTVRGREVCRSPQEILSQAKYLVSEGVREITLLGQNVNSYRWTDGETWDFPSLLQAVSNIEGLARLRFTTSHPKDLSDRLIKCFQRIHNLCPHIHLPFQSGSNPVLRRMGRGYTREEYLDLIDKLRNTRGDIAITSDVMVGFPGESREDFESTLDLIVKAKFDSLFSFKYSDREGTAAKTMTNKVPDPEKANRLKILQEIQRGISLEKNKHLQGKESQILVEGYSKKGNELTGRTGSNKVVNFEGNFHDIGHLVNVQIEGYDINSLKAIRI